MKQQYLSSLVIAISLMLASCGGGGSGTSTTTPTSTVPTMTAAVASVVEGNTGTSTLDFTVTLSEALTEPVTVDYYTADGTATAGTDYTAIPATTVVIPSGSTTATVSVTVTGDTLYEADETLTLHVSSPSHTSLGSANVVGTITNDDSAPSVAIAAASVAEGNTGTSNLDFTVTLSAASGLATTVDYATSDGTAVAGTDYIAGTGTLSIPAGAITGTVTVTVTGETLFENDETLHITLATSTHATITTATVTGTITNDDTAPSVSIAVAPVVEGNTGTSNMNFTVTLSAVSAFATTVNYATSDGTAVAGADYTTGTGTLSIPAGATTGTITVAVAGETLFETDETLNITLTNPANATITTAAAIGTITNDDSIPVASVSAAMVTEGDIGTINMVFTISLSNLSSSPTTINYTTSDATAKAGTDYSVTQGSQLITGLSTTVAVPIIGDTLTEGNETFNFTLSSGSNAVVSTTANTAIGTIVDNDVPTAPTAVNLNTSKMSLAFSWTAGTKVDHYRILVNPDGASGFTVDPYASNIANTATSHSIIIPVYSTNWVAAQYMVEACDTAELFCIAAPNQTLSQIDSIAATVFVKNNSPRQGQEFGYATALSSDGYTLAVSAWADDKGGAGINPAVAPFTPNSGAVYVFTRGANNTWLQQASIKASNPGQLDRFGNAIDISDDGNTLAVGALTEDGGSPGVNGTQNDTRTDAGAVYVFTRTGAVWSQQAYIKASNAGSGDLFGRSVALSGNGNTLAIGANGEDSSLTGIPTTPQTVSNPNNIAVNSGAVYVFSRSVSIWSQQAYIKASNAQASDSFGFSVALDTLGNTLAVGAFGEDSNATGINGNQANNSNLSAASGATYVFTRAATTWSQQVYIKASNTGAGDEFGSAMTLSGDGNTLIVSAPKEDSSATGLNGDQAANNAVDSGAVYGFRRTGGVWSQQGYIKALNTEASDNFGAVLALSSDGLTLVVGARLEDSIARGVGGDQVDNTSSDAGAAYVYKFGTTTKQYYLKALNTDSADSFGTSVAVSTDGKIIAVGANGEDSASATFPQFNNRQTTGAVYLY